MIVGDDSQAGRRDRKSFAINVNYLENC